MGNWNYGHIIQVIAKAGLTVVNNKIHVHVQYTKLSYENNNIMHNLSNTHKDPILIFCDK